MNLYYAIVGYLHDHGEHTRPEIAKALGVSVRAVNRVMTPSPSDGKLAHLFAESFRQTGGLRGKGSHNNPAIFNLEYR